MCVVQGKCQAKLFFMHLAFEQLLIDLTPTCFARIVEGWKLDCGDCQSMWLRVCVSWGPGDEAHGFTDHSFRDTALIPAASLPISAPWTPIDLRERRSRCLWGQPWFSSYVSRQTVCRTVDLFGVKIGGRTNYTQ